jgi:DNA-binding HxlR family transcriptional regulator
VQRPCQPVRTRNALECYEIARSWEFGDETACPLIGTFAEMTTQRRQVTCIIIVSGLLVAYLHDESKSDRFCLYNIKVSARWPVSLFAASSGVGEWWSSILIIRETLHGFTRFDEFQKSLPIAPNMLARRLSGLVDAGLLERRRYNQRPPRYEYILTDMGRDFCPVIVAMFAGQQTLRSRGRERIAGRQKDQEGGRSRARRSEERKTAQRARICVCRRGPAASERTRRRYAMVNQKKPIARSRTSRLVRGRKRRSS